jgi:hypothetical protein
MTQLPDAPIEPQIIAQHTAAQAALGYIDPALARA